MPEMQLRASCVPTCSYLAQSLLHTAWAQSVSLNTWARWAYSTFMVISPCAFWSSTLLASLAVSMCARSPLALSSASMLSFHSRKLLSLRLAKRS